MDGGGLSTIRRRLPLIHRLSPARISGPPGRDDPAMDVDTALASRRGVGRREGLLVDGVTDRQLDRAVRAGIVHRVGRGGYALPGADPALVAAVAVCGVASHASAARLHGLDLHRRPNHPLQLLDVTVPRGSRPRWSRTRIHRAALAPDEYGTRIPVTSLIRTLSDCGRTLPLVEAVVILDSALREHQVTIERLRALARAARGPGSGNLRRAVAHVDAMSGSTLESRTRLLVDLLTADVQSQVYVEGVGRVDFLLNGWLVIETDGYEYHRDRAEYRNDRRRGNLLVVGRFVVLRLSWEDVFLQAKKTLAQIEAVLAQRP